LFRSFEPGLAPWFFTKSVIAWMNLALKQLIEVSIKKVENAIPPLESDRIMIRKWEDQNSCSACLENGQLWIKCEIKKMREKSMFI